MNITINKDSTLDILFAAEITKKYYKNEYFKKNLNLFIKMCKLLESEININNIENYPLYFDVKEWIESYFPKKLTYNNKILNFNDKCNLLLNNITELPKCKCKHF